MNGLCSTHPNPDMWFPEELPHQRGGGRPSLQSKRHMAMKATLAMAICQDCPIRARCLEEGMREENIEHGIWGGMLAGDRIILSRTRKTGTVREQAIAFAEGVKTWQSIS
jgi:Transcription factor WhiB